MSLQENINKNGSPLAMLRSTPAGHPFPYPMEYENWRDEQRAWHDTAILFDQSFHMSDLYIKGPDIKRLLEATSTNSYANLEAGRAKQFLAVNHEGYVIGDAILVALSDDEVTLAGFEHSLNWLQYIAQRDGYDVAFELEQNSKGEAGSKRLYRYELEGPNAWKILEKAAGKKLDRIKFFHTAKLDLNGLDVWALNHTMGGVPGAESTGLELFGPAADTQKFLETILEAGKEYGLVRGGFLSYMSTVIESGWIGAITPAVYTSPELSEYREWLSENSVENYGMALVGSFAPESVEGFYSTPWDLGYGHMIKFDHDFVGRPAVEKIKDAPPRRKAWLLWNEEDVKRVEASAGGSGTAFKPLPLPINVGWDEVRLGDELVGVTHVSGYTENIGRFASVGTVRSDLAVDGNELELVWGDHDGGVSNPLAPEHVQTRVRVTVRTKSPETP